MLRLIPADRISYDPGDQAQCDLWFPEVRIPVGTGKPRVLPVLVMVCSHSRFVRARMLPPRMTGDLLAGMWELIGSPGAVPRRLIWDNEAGIGRRNSYAAGVAAFAGVHDRVGMNAGAEPLAPVLLRVLGAEHC